MRHLISLSIRLLKSREFHEAKAQILHQAGVVELESIPSPSLSLYIGILVASSLAAGYMATRSQAHPLGIISMSIPCLVLKTEKSIPFSECISLISHTTAVGGNLSAFTISMQWSDSWQNTN